jgi:hypothetical protein
VQCRWAFDYGVASTAEKLGGDDLAARFVADVKKLAGAKAVIPVWTTECEEIDLPVRLRPDAKSTGLCGEVGCATGTCPKAFTRQWSTLLAAVGSGPVGILALDKEFDRTTGPSDSQPAPWPAQVVSYLDTVPPQHGGQATAHDRLWLVVQGHGAKAAQRAAAESAAAETGAAAVLVALTRIDQSYQPRIVAAKQR